MTDSFKLYLDSLDRRNDRRRPVFLDISPLGVFEVPYGLRHLSIENLAVMIGIPMCMRYRRGEPLGMIPVRSTVIEVKPGVFEHRVIWDYPKSITGE